MHQTIPQKLPPQTPKPRPKPQKSAIFLFKSIKIGRIYSKFTQYKDLKLFIQH